MILNGSVAVSQSSRSSLEIAAIGFQRNRAQALPVGCCYVVRGA
jgi:hypothetical protein